MDASSQAGGQRIFRVVDIGLAVSLLVAVLAVVAVDRTGPVEVVQGVDLVFILDQRPDMRDLIEGMKANCLEKAESLNSAGVDCRFAVIPFGKKQHRVPAVAMTGDLAGFKSKLLASAEGGPDAAADSSTEALDQALGLEFRKEAQILFVMISKVPSQDAGPIAGVASRMNERGITAIIQADAAEKDRCQPLCQNGRFYSMEGDDLTGAVASSKPDKTGTRAASLIARLAPEKRAGATQLVKVKGIYAVRTAPDRKKIIVGLGGTPESELAVKAGLDWLARHQAEDGSWSDEHMCEREQPCSDLKYGAMRAETGLAVLAFQAGGHYSFNGQDYSANVKRGLDWLVKQQHEDGNLFGPQHTWYEHGIATFALAEACAVALANDKIPDERYMDAARRAIKFIEYHQYQSGGWQYVLDNPGVGDTSVSGWQILALKSAMEAKIDVSTTTMDRVCKFYERCGLTGTGQTSYQPGGHVSDLTTAVGLIVQEFILKKPNSPMALKAIEFLRQRAKQGIGQSGDFYTLYNATLAMFLAKGDAWDDWNREVRDAIVKRQVKAGCARGSWNHSYHRTLDTAWAVLTLEVYYRYSTE